MKHLNRCFDCGAPLTHKDFQNADSLLGTAPRPDYCTGCAVKLSDSPEPEDDEPICMGCGSRCGTNGRCME